MIGNQRTVSASPHSDRERIIMWDSVHHAAPLQLRPLSSIERLKLYKTGQEKDDQVFKIHDFAVASTSVAFCVLVFREAGTLMSLPSNT